MQIFYSVPENLKKEFGINLKSNLKMAQFAIYSVFHWWIESQILAELSHVRSARSGAPLVMKI